MRITILPNMLRFIFLSLVTAPIAMMGVFTSGTVADAKLIVREKTKYYNITGRNGAQVHSKLGRRGPWKIRKKHAIAATVRTFEFKNIRFGTRGNKCVLTNVDVHLSLTYYFPRWTNKRMGSKKLQKLWEVFSRELVRHERTHGKYFKDTMRQFEKELLGMTAKKSNGCSSMMKSAKMKLDKIDAKGDLRHAAFDRREKKSTSKVRKLEKAIAKTR